MRGIWGLLLIIVSSAHCAAEPALLRFSQSPGWSGVLDCNQQGLILGEHEVAEPAIGLSLQPLLRRGDVDLPLPIPESFTHIEVSRVSENGLVIGFATRPIGHPQGNQQACVWYSQTGQVQLLDTPDGYRGSSAFDIDAAGLTASGYVVGRDPPRLSPCIWQRSGALWRCMLLAAPQAYNPLLTSAHVVISDDGQRIAASLVVESGGGDLPPFINHLFTWERADEGAWNRRLLTDRAVHLANINNRGVVAGRVTVDGQRKAFVYHPQCGPRVLSPLPGDASCEATDVNNQDTVVGWSDPPRGPAGGPRAFVWRDDQLSQLPLPPEAKYSTAKTITDDHRVGGSLHWEDKDAEVGQEYAFVLQLDAARPAPAAATAIPPPETK